MLNFFGRRAKGAPRLVGSSKEVCRQFGVPSNHSDAVCLNRSVAVGDFSLLPYLAWSGLSTVSMSTTPISNLMWANYGPHLAPQNDKLT